jgi:thiol-disulfide isomerase/thioredoxin
MLERIIIVLSCAALLVVAIALTRWWNARRIRDLQEVSPDWTALGTEPDGRRTLIAFSTPSCAACHKAQAPAIDLVRAEIGDEALRVIKIDAASQPRVASAFGILTVPSTVIVAAGGQRIVAVNQGFAPSARLVQQLQLA